MVTPARFLQDWLDANPAANADSPIWCALPVLAWLQTTRGACAMGEADIVAAYEGHGCPLKAMRASAPLLGLTTRRVAQASPGDIAIVRAMPSAISLALVARSRGDDALPLCALATVERAVIVGRFPVSGVWGFH